MVSSILPLHLEKVTVRKRGRRVLGPIDLTMGTTGITAIMGPNGSGKTTLLRTMHGLERAKGRINWAVPNEATHGRQAFVFQSPVMMRRSVLENLLYPLKINGVPKSEARSKAEAWAKRIGLGHALHHPAPRLSGGEKQKLALGRALIRAPEVLFLDEPCANLDGAATREIETLLLEAHTAGTRIVLSTHNIGQARRLASDVIFLLKGRIAEHGSAPPFFEATQTPEAQAFLRGDIVE